ncbi:hypothetical protein JMJ77_0006969, partial [Colletotrichum scovillei]
ALPTHGSDHGKKRVTGATGHRIRPSTVGGVVNHRKKEPQYWFPGDDVSCPGPGHQVSIFGQKQKKKTHSRPPYGVDGSLQLRQSLNSVG